MTLLYWVRNVRNYEISNVSFRETTHYRRDIRIIPKATHPFGEGHLHNGEHLDVGYWGFRIQYTNVLFAYMVLRSATNLLTVPFLPKGGMKFRGD